MLDTTSYLNSIQTSTAASSGSSSSSSSSSSKTSMGQDDFLKILVTQLQTQDPFNSMDTTQMVGQLTQFSMLEQLTNMNTTLTSGLSALSLQTATSASAYIGKSVMASGYSLSVASGTASSCSYTLGSDATSVKAYVYDSQGDVVRTVDIGTKKSGTYDFQWDGKDSSGKTVDDGTYSLAIVGKDSTNSDVKATTTISGVVSGVSVASGSIMLTLKDGRQVALSNISSVTDTDA